MKRGIIGWFLWLKCVFKIISIIFIKKLVSLQYLYFDSICMYGVVLFLLFCYGAEFYVCFLFTLSDFMLFYSFFMLFCGE